MRKVLLCAFAAALSSSQVVPPQAYLGSPAAIAREAFTQSLRTQPASSAPIQQTRQVISGGYSEIRNPRTSLQVQEVLEFLKGYLSPQLSKASLVRVSSQVVNGVNYELIYEIQSVPGVKQQYVVVVYKPLNGALEVKSTNYLNAPKPAPSSFRQAKNTGQVPYINEIDQMIRKLLPSTAKFDLVGVDFFPPHYVLRYDTGSNTILRLELSFDPITGNLSVESSQTVPRSDPTVRPPQPTPQIKQTQPVVTPQPVPEIKQTRPVVTPPPTVRPAPQAQQPTPAQKPALRRVPTFSVSLSPPQLVSSTAGISDPALIPFLTASQNVDSGLISSVCRFLIDKVVITDDFSVVLVNQIKYGMRLVAQLKDSRLFEALVTSDSKQPELLFWRRISAISDVDPEVFSQYYKIEPDEDLKALIRSTFRSEEAVSNFKSIPSCEKRVTFDGVYYRAVVESASNNRFLIVFYYVPERNYQEIIQYEIINNDYDTKREVRLSRIPNDDVYFKAARQTVLKNYAQTLQDCSLEFVANSESQLNRHFRLVFSGLKGRFEAILGVNKQTGSVIVNRWEKLQYGYVPVPLESLSNNQEFQAVRKSVGQFVKSKFNIEASPSFFELKSIPNASLQYKFLFNRPLPFVLSVEQTMPDGALNVRGVERVQIAPTSEYYNDRVFAGYTQVNIAELKFDETYQTLYSILESSQPWFKSSSVQLGACFRLKTPQNIFYRAVYKARGAEYLATLSLTFEKSQYELITFEPYTRQVEAGDYRWNCEQYNDQSRVCEQCSKQAILTAGRCYKKLNSCTVQIGSTCYSCEAGCIRTGGACERAPEKAQPTITPAGSIKQVVATSEGPVKIVYESGTDVNCLQFRGGVCSKCSNRYFLSSGACKRVPDQCQTYNEDTGECLTCFSGFYFNSGQCIAMDPLCSEANSRGECTKCYKNYVNIEGKCYIKSNVPITGSEVPKDQLCIEWKDGRCAKCEPGTFMSQKSGLCTIKDPFCQRFDQSAEECEVCIRGYRLNQSTRKCQRN